MGFRLFNRKAVIHLDATPSGFEEYDAWNDQVRVNGWDIDDAKLRVDKISRRLVTIWSFFLAWIILAQGNGDGTTQHIFGYDIRILPSFHLKTAEFIAVVTTTTASVFGFLLIVTNHLFRVDKAGG